MKNKFIVWLIVSIVIMIILPWLVNSFVSSDAGMAACFLLFFLINPIYSVIMGAFAAKNFKELWEMPFVSAALFFLGSWIFFDTGEKAFIIYAGIYLILGLVAMTISMVIDRKLQS